MGNMAAISLLMSSSQHIVGTGGISSSFPTAAAIILAASSLDVCDNIATLAPADDEETSSPDDDMVKAKAVEAVNLAER